MSTVDERMELEAVDLGAFPQVQKIGPVQWQAHEIKLEPCGLVEPLAEQPIQNLAMGCTLVNTCPIDHPQHSTQILQPVQMASAHVS